MKRVTLSGCEALTGTTVAENDPEAAGAGDTVTSLLSPAVAGAKHANIVAQTGRFSMR
jgi:hypothetical protein